MLNIKYLTPVDREFYGLSFHDLFKVPDAVAQEKKAWN
jgi:hypothetical protein